MLRDMRELLIADRLPPWGKQKVEDWMLHNTTGPAMIRGGVPADWRVGDKTGRNESVSNDIALLRPPTGPPILLCIYLSSAAVNAEQRAAAIVETTKEVLKTLLQDGEEKKPAAF